MEIKEAEFISSITNPTDLPKTDLPEFAFIGRSNVGKSSLINMVTQRKHLAKISVKPGKTQTINHYLINKSWYLVDLPGYGYAKVSKTKRAGFGAIIENYVLKSENLYALFILIDIRLSPQPIDLDFINWAGQKKIPIVILYTKADKLSKSTMLINKEEIEKALSQYWESLPPSIVTSSVSKTGREALLDLIQNTL